MSGRHLSQRDKALVADPWLVAWTAYARARPRRANASSSFRTIRVVEKLPELGRGLIALAQEQTRLTSHEHGIASEFCHLLKAFP
jgi:hypothetical protein